jgi:hypothetical protein
LRKFLALAALLLAGCGASPEKSDWERQNETLLEKEDNVAPKPPPFPRRENLVAFEVGGPTQGFRYFVDSASLRVATEKQRLIQYVVVARSPSGVDNVSFEALRCTTAEFRTYAYGQANGTWAERAGAWRPVTGQGARPWNAALANDYFCPQAVPVRSVDEALRALQQGGNPFSKGFSGDALLGR